MSDIGHEQTEHVLKTLEKDISEEYKKAEEEIEKKLNDYLEKFKKKDALKRQAVLNGQITQEEYEQWRLGQIAIGKRWKEMRDSLAQDLANAAQISKSITNGYMPEVYAINHNYGTFQVEQESLVDTSYTLYDRQAVEAIFKEERELYHSPGWRTRRNINMGKQLAWDKKQVQSVMTQALLQGESIGKIATRLSQAVGESDRKAAIRNARTMATGVQNAGRVDSYKRAEGMGIKLQQEWLATLDNRTRHEHRVLDGQRVPVGEKFEVDGYEIEYPGDPTAEAFLVYNCRCTLVPVLKGYEGDNSWKDEALKDMTYEEWVNGHVTSDSITKQDELSEYYKDQYINEYKVMENSPEVNVSRQDASDDWFEYEKANAMSEYIKTGKMPATDIYGNELSAMERARLIKEAELIQTEGERTKTGFKTVYRGAVYDEDEVRRLFTPNDTYTFETLTATATDKNIANIYNNIDNYTGDGKPVPVIFEIQKPDGIYGFNRDDIEVVIPAGSKYKVVRNYMDEDGVVHVSLYSKKGINVNQSKSTNELSVSKHDDKIKKGYSDALGKHVRFFTQGMTEEEYAAYKRDIESASVCRTVKLGKQEYEILRHAMNQFIYNATDTTYRKQGIVTKEVGDYIYTVVNYGFNEYRVINKKRIK